MSREEQERVVALMRLLLQKVGKYCASHSALSIKPAVEKAHDTLALANAISECEEFLQPFDKGCGWRGFIGRLRGSDNG
jgi:hypothetical protein